MSKHPFLAGSLAALAFAAPLQAQSAPSSSIQITPYAGYLDAGAIVSGPAGTTMRHSGAPVYGGELALGLGRGLSLVGNVAYSRRALEVAAPLVGGLPVGESSVLLYDAALRLNLPLSSSSLSPFIQAGAGEMRQTMAIGPIATRSTSFAYNVGGGMDVRVAPRLGLRLLAKDYIARVDAQEAAGLQADTKTTHNWAVSAGLRVGI